MKGSLAWSVSFILLTVNYPPPVFADTVVFSNGRTLSGTVVRTNGDDVLIVTDFAAFNFSRGSIKEINVEQAESVEPSSTNRLAAFKVALALLAKQPWAADLRPIPATVIDKGILRNVPYTSFRCGDDYEVNIYGDLEHPAGIEVGVYRKLLEDASAKKNCLNLTTEFLGRPEDKEFVRGLSTDKDLKTKDGLTFEITPPSAEDAYMGWWVSVYSESLLNGSRASEDEMKRISIPKAEAEREASAADQTSWSAQDLKLARKTFPATISFVSKSGTAVTNAQVVRVNDGVSLIWRDGASGGVAKLADLPEDLQASFGYDPDKARAADLAEEAKRARETQPTFKAGATVSVPERVANSTTYSFQGYSGGSVPASRAYGSRSLSTGGRVFVRAYFRKDGTYVQSHTRSAPRRR
jgi:hypothetical protein